MRMKTDRTYFEISHAGKPPFLARFKWGKWKQKKDSISCMVKLETGITLKFKENKHITPT